MLNNKSSLRVYQYTDYRQFLKDYYEEQKKITTSFSYRYFAKKAGISSVGLYKDVIEGRKYLGRLLIHKFAKALQLSTKEAEYFEYMVYFNEVSTMEERDLYFKKMMARYESKAYKIDSAKYEYYSKWYYSAIMTLLSYRKISDNYKEIADLLNPSIRPEQVKKALKVMEKLDIIEKNGDGFYSLVNNTISTSVKKEEEKIRGMNVINFQKAMTNMALGAYEINEIKDLDMSTLTLSVSGENVKALKAELAALRKKFANMAEHEPNPDRVYQLNCSFFSSHKN